MHAFRFTFSGGVLEAEGLVSIKLRLKEQRAMMQRLDPEISRIQGCPPSKERTEQLRAREELLAPLYHTVAVHFADLHDTPVRMKEKSVIREIIPWRESRTLLFWRLKRRLLEESLKREIADESLGHGQKTEMIRRWFIEDVGDRTLWDQDSQVVRWLENQVDPRSRKRVVRENVKAVTKDHRVRKFRHFLDQMCPDDLQELGVHLVQQLTPSKRQEFLSSVSLLASNDNDIGESVSSEDNNSES